MVAVAELGIEVNKVFVVVALEVFVEDKLNKNKREYYHSSSLNCDYDFRFNSRYYVDIT